ncbi:MAG: cell division protein FtsQ/DivIB [Breznakia sp.]
MEDEKKLVVNQFKALVDLDKVLEKDEQETRYDQVIKHRKKLTKRRKVRRIILIVLVVILILGYFVTPISNIKVLQVNNNRIYTKEQVLTKADVSYGQKIILKPGLFIEELLEKDPLIKRAEVHKKYLDGAVYIEIEEEKVIGYYEREDKKINYVLGSGEIIVLTSEEMALVSSPRILDLDDAQMQKLVAGLNDVDLEDILLISEIRHYETSYSQDMLELMMVDGHIVRTSYAGLPMLSSYREMLKGTKSDLRCFVFVEEEGSSYTTKCE